MSGVAGASAPRTKAGYLFQTHTEGHVFPMRLAKLSVVQASTEWAMARFLAVWTCFQSRLAVSFPRHLLLFALPGAAI